MQGWGSWHPLLGSRGPGCSARRPRGRAAPRRSLVLGQEAELQKRAGNSTADFTVVVLVTLHGYDQDWTDTHEGPRAGQASLEKGLSPWLQGWQKGFCI